MCFKCLEKMLCVAQLILGFLFLYSVMLNKIEAQHSHTFALLLSHTHTLHCQVPGLAVAICLTFQVSSEEVCSVPLSASSHLHQQ